MKSIKITNLEYKFTKNPHQISISAPIILESHYYKMSEIIEDLKEAGAKDVRSALKSEIGHSGHFTFSRESLLIPEVNNQIFSLIYDEKDSLEKCILNFWLVQTNKVAKNLSQQEQLALFIDQDILEQYIEKFQSENEQRLPTTDELSRHFKAPTGKDELKQVQAPAPKKPVSPQNQQGSFFGSCLAIFQCCLKPCAPKNESLELDAPSYQRLDGGA